MSKLLGLLVMVVALSFLGLPAAMAADGTPPTTQNPGDNDKDKHHRHHHRHHRKHHHHRHHKHPQTTTNPNGTNS